MSNKPYIIDFGKIGSTENGFISIAHLQNTPFHIQRVYWTYNTPDGVVRGHHAHKKLHQMIFAVHGNITMHIENEHGVMYKFNLNTPASGLYIPPRHWRTIEMSNNAVLLCLASEEYNEDDYIRNYDDFKRIRSIN
jgi:dTDP-4-dehydrorhamnose 3,5-epimerase-like enzyme